MQCSPMSPQPSIGRIKDPPHLCHRMQYRERKSASFEGAVIAITSSTKHESTCWYGGDRGSYRMHFVRPLPRQCFYVHGSPPQRRVSHFLPTPTDDTRSAQHMERAVSSCLRPRRFASQKPSQPRPFMSTMVELCSPSILLIGYGADLPRTLC